MSTFVWQRTLKRMDFAPVRQIAYMAEPKFPHDADAHDRELLESHFGQAVEHLSDWHYNGRDFRLADGREGRLDARSWEVTWPEATTETFYHDRGELPAA